MNHPQHTVNRMIAVLDKLVGIADNYPDMLDSVPTAYESEFNEAKTLLAEIKETPIYVDDPDKDKYNGWTNHASWCVNLWLDNMTLEDLVSDPDEYNTDHSLTVAAADALKDYVEEFNPLADEANMYSDLLNDYISDVNFYEIAQHYVADYRYDHPTVGTKRNAAQYLVEPDLTFPLWAVYDHEGDEIESGLSFAVDPDVSFWDSFTTCIQHAIDNDYQSIVVEWKIQTFDVENWKESKVNLLIAAQGKRSTHKGK